MRATANFGPADGAFGGCALTFCLNMKHVLISLLIVTLAAYCGCKGNRVRHPDPAHTIAGDIEEMVRVPSEDGTPDRVFLILTAPGGAAVCQDIAFRNTQVARKYWAPNTVVVFFIRPTKDSRRGLLSAFSMEQLVELGRMTETDARRKIAEHQWTLGEQPDWRKIWQNDELQPTK